MPRHAKTHTSHLTVRTVTPNERMALELERMMEKEESKPRIQKEPPPEVTLAVAHNIDAGHYAVCGCGSVYAGEKCPLCHLKKGVENP